MPTLEDLSEKLDAIIRGQSHPWPRWLSVQISAEYASLSEVSIRRLINSGKLTARRPCKGKILVDRHQIDSLISGATATPRSGRGIRAGSKAG